MKKLYTLALLFITIGALGQAPQLIPYQAIARDAAGQALANASINARFTIHDETATGTAVWQEIQTVTTSALGLFTVQLGSSVSLGSVNWANGSKFMKVEIDLGAGFVEIGTQQMLGVPYALYSRSVKLNVSGQGDTLYVGDNNFVIVPGISEANDFGDNGTTGTTLHTCGAPNVHNPELTYGTMTDQEGNAYKTIVIGTQEWMAENLKTRFYGNGDGIPNASNCCSHYYDFDESYSCPHGMTYNWYVCTDSRQLCPVGWHVPSDAEWTVLSDFLGGNEIAGGKMKSIGNLTDSSGFWLSPNEGASNISGFSALPSGAFSHNMNGGFMEFLSINNFGYYWSSTSINAESSYYRVLTYNSESIIRNYYSKLSEYSVRCVRNQ
jgi:uncharacterized protein (TIGR02145 family)